MNRLMHTASLFAALIATTSCATPSPVGPRSTQAPAPRPDRNQPGPWDSDVLVIRIGTDGRQERLGAFERAGVPTIARLLDGRLIAAYQAFPADDSRNFDRVAVRFSSDEGRSWTAPAPIAVEGLETGLARPFDPTLVPLPDGRVRLYFTSNRNADFQRGTPAIYSAISTDAINYTFEPGVRFGLEGRVAIDCAVALHAGVFHLFVPDNGTLDDLAAADSRGAPPRGGSGYHAVSRDGLTFERLADITLTGGNRWLGNALSDGGQLVFFGMGPGPWPVTSTDGVTWAPSASGAQFTGADPGALKLKDGSWLIVTTGPPRAGTPGSLPQSQPGGPSATPGPQPQGARVPFRVEVVTSTYSVSAPAAPGLFKTGQSAALVLGAPGFNDSGGGLLFNHPTGLATDGTALLVADRFNNRVLVWKSAPAGNTPPDLVLGQPDFVQNDPGVGRDRLNWPGNVALTPDGRRIAVADTNNDRVLIWNSFPSRSGAAADLVLDLNQIASATDRPVSPATPGPGGGNRLAWPWGVWTDGTRLAVVATQGRAILIWNAFPNRNNQPPDIVLRPAVAGTPRNISSDGSTFFAVSDHNNGPASQPATMVWRGFPTSADQAPDFVLAEWLKGSFVKDGRLVMAGAQQISIWDTPPVSAAARANVVVRPPTYRNGDGPDAVIASGRLYVSNYNGNNMLVWNAIPAQSNTPPDFSIGSATVVQDTWADNFFITNPVLATDGTSLFASSDFDRKIFVWRKLPGESAAKPDLVIHTPEAMWDNELHGTTLAMAGKGTVYVWRRLPLNGETPDVTLSGRAGNVQLGELTGVAFDDRYFYLSDRRTERIYVWDGIPAADRDPVFTLTMRSPGRLTSDGTWLCAAPFEGGMLSLWRIADLRAGAQPISVGSPGQFNLPSECLVADGRLIVANRSFNRVDIWNRIEDALAGKPADALLGTASEQDRKPEIGRNQLFMPGSIAWGGGHLWVGEFKFSTRILQFTPKP